jgi:hypothetical protein
MTHPDLTNAVWRKASLSESAQGCVEVAILPDGLVAVRDSKDTQLPAHVYEMSDWISFLDGLRAGRASGDVRIQVEIGDHDVALSDSLGIYAPHHYTHREWLFFLDGVLRGEPQLAAAGA